MKCNNKPNPCDKGCLEFVSGECVNYTGPDTAYLQIPNGMNLDDIVQGIDSTLALMSEIVAETDDQTLSFDLETGRLDIIRGNYVVIPIFKGIGIADTTSVDLQGNGYNTALSAVVKVSTQPGNILSITSDGLYANSPINLSNGITFDALTSSGQLGGSLTKDTTINPGIYNFNISNGNLTTQLNSTAFTSQIQGPTATTSFRLDELSFSVNRPDLSNLFSVANNGQLRASAYDSARVASNLNTARVLGVDGAGNFQVVNTLNGVTVNNGISKTTDNTLQLGGNPIIQNTTLSYNNGSSVRLLIDLANRYLPITNGRLSLGNVDYGSPSNYNILDINTGAGVATSALNTTATNSIVSVRTATAAANGVYTGIGFGLNRDQDAGGYLKAGIVYQATTGDATNRYGDLLFLNREYTGVGDKSPFDVDTDVSFAIRNNGKVEVIGNAFKLGGLSADPSGDNGDLYYNTASNTFRAYQNGAWTTLGGGGGGDIYSADGTITDPARTVNISSTSTLNFRKQNGGGTAVGLLTVGGTDPDFNVTMVSQDTAGDTGSSYLLNSTGLQLFTGAGDVTSRISMYGTGTVNTTIYNGVSQEQAGIQVDVDRILNSIFDGVSKTFNVIQEAGTLSVEAYDSSDSSTLVALRAEESGNVLVEGYKNTLGQAQVLSTDVDGNLVLVNKSKSTPRLITTAANFTIAPTDEVVIVDGLTTGAGSGFDITLPDPTTNDGIQITFVENSASNWDSSHTIHRTSGSPLTTLTGTMLLLAANGKWWKLN